jgi:hypothetical protein
MRPDTGQAKTESSLDRTTLTVATLASVLGATVTSAVGSGFLASLIAAAIVPAVTAFLVHPGPHRRRRITAVLTLVMLLRGGREAVAKGRRRSAPARTRTRGLMFNASAAFVCAVVLLTLFEVLMGHAAIADRQLTLLPDGSASNRDRHVEVAASPPMLFVPEHRVVKTARSAAGARVTYPVRAVDAQGDRLVARCTPPSGARFPIGDTVVQCTATDSGGLNAAARFTVTVEAGEVRAAVRTGRPAQRERGAVESRRDTAAPTLRLPDDIAVRSRSLGAVVTYDATAVDAGDGAVATACVPASGSRFPVGRTVVACSATDRAGNRATGSFAVVVSPVPVDVVPPRLRLPDRVEREAADRSGAIVGYSAHAVDRRDGPVTVDCEPPSGSRFRVGRTIVRCSASDRAGNVARGRFAVVVRLAPKPDRVPPVLKLPADIERETSDPVVEYAASAVDDRDGPVPVDCEPPSGSRFPVGRTIVTCSATDHAGNVARDQFAVIVSATPDRVPPELRLPKDIAAELGTAVEYEASAVDDRDGPVPVDCRPASGSPFPIGRTTVECTASDRAGNVARGSFAVTVAERDTVPPRLDLPQRVVVDATDASGAVVQYPASAVDDRDGPVAIECDPPSGSRFALGRTLVRCTASDRAGNVARGRFVVVVNEPADTEPPELEIPDGVAQNTTDSSGAVIEYPARAVDRRDGPVDVACDPPSGSRFTVGRTLVRCSAADRAGNVATGEFAVVVTLVEPPLRQPR